MLRIDQAEVKILSNRFQESMFRSLRWSILSTGIRTDPRTAARIILAVFILHNYGVELGYCRTDLGQVTHKLAMPRTRLPRDGLIAQL